MQNRKAHTRRFEPLEDRTLLAANLVADINQVASQSGNPRDFVSVADETYFVAENEQGSELWVLDASTEVSNLVKDIAPGPDGSYPFNLVSANELLFFQTDAGVWRSDGTEDGTVLVEANTEIIASTGSEVLLLRDQQFSVANGVSQSTPVIKLPDTPRRDEYSFNEVTEDGFVMSLGLTLVMVSDSGVPSAFGTSPGRNFPTVDAEAGAILFNRASGPTYFPFAGEADSEGMELANLPSIYIEESAFRSGQFVYFMVNVDGANQQQLWRTDNTVDGTFALATFDSRDSNSTAIVAVNGDQGAIWFSATTTDLGQELWYSDGTVEGTKLVKDIAGDAASSAPYDITVTEGRAWFVAANGLSGKQIWTSDGTDAGTMAVSSFDSTSFDPHILHATADQVAFSVGTQQTGIELWVAGIASDSSQLVKDIAPRAQNSLPGLLTSIGENEFIFAATGVTGRELWKSNLTPNGTQLLREIAEGEDTFGSNPTNLTQFRDRLFFTASDGEHGGELWSTNGTEDGTQLVLDVNPGPANATIGNLLPIGDVLYFTADDGQHGLELWQTDGTALGTKIAGQANLGEGSSIPTEIQEIDGNLYFFATNGESPRAPFYSEYTAEMSIWKFDGESLTQFYNAPGEELLNLTVFNGNLYFNQTDGVRRASVVEITPAGETQTIQEGFTLRDAPVMYADDTQLVYTDGSFTAVAYDGEEKNRIGPPDLTPPTIMSTGEPPFNLIFQNDFGNSRILTGDPNAPTVLHEFSSRDVFTRQTRVVEVDNQFYFLVTQDADVELWKTDGTVVGTTSLAIPPNIERQFDLSLTAIGDQLFFAGNDGANGNELWSWTPTVQPGDFDGNGTIDATDIDLLFAAVSEADSHTRFDLNDDESVDDKDIDYLLNDVLDRKRGDTNLDGKVNFADFLIVSREFGNDDAGWSQGDFSGDRKVSFADFLTLSANFVADDGE